MARKARTPLTAYWPWASNHWSLTVAGPQAFILLAPRSITPPDSGYQTGFETGRRHILITLGTHLAWHKDQVADAALQLARTLPDCIFHFTDGDPASELHSSAGNFIRVPWINYETCIAHYDVVIHHGGAGIMYYCLENNIPVLVYPVDFDQFDHAARLAAAGKGVWLKGGPQALIHAKPEIERLLGRKDGA